MRAELEQIMTSNPPSVEESTMVQSTTEDDEDSQDGSTEYTLTEETFEKRLAQLGVIAKQFGKEKVALLKKLKNLEEVNEYEISEAQEMIDYHQRKSIIQGYEIDNLEAQIIAMEREMETKIKQFDEEIHEEKDK